MTRPGTQERTNDIRATQRPVRDRRRATRGGRAPGMLALAARLATAALVVATGAIHLYLYHLYFSAIPTIGRLFLLNFAASLVIGVLIAAMRTPWVSLIGAGFCLGTLGAFLFSVHWGLFGYQETLHGTWQIRAAAVEVAGSVAGMIAAVLTWRRVRAS